MISGKDLFNYEKIYNIQWTLLNQKPGCIILFVILIALMLCWLGLSPMIELGSLTFLDF